MAVGTLRCVPVTPVEAVCDAWKVQIVTERGDDFNINRDLPGYDVKRAKRYARTRLGLGLLGATLSVSRTLWFARSGRSARLRTWSESNAPHPALAEPIYLTAEGVGSWLASLPMGYLAGHRLERAYGLTKQTTRGWAGDQAKSVGIGLALQVPLTLGAFRVIRRRPQDWWLVLAGATVPLMVALSYVAPTVLMPLFNRFEPLRDADLSARIMRLSDRAHVPVATVMTMDMSRQSDKPNAFFAGVGNSKRIVLADTLMEKFTADEIEGVIAHELGHQVHGDMWRFVRMAAGIGVGGAWAMAKVAPTWIRRNASASGVTSIEDVASMPLLQVLLSGGGLVVGPAMAAFSRRIEQRTDRYALRLTDDGATYASAMGKLATYSLADPDPPRLLVALLGSHPPIAARIRMARAFDRAKAENAVDTSS